MAKKEVAVSDWKSFPPSMRIRMIKLTRTEDDGGDIFVNIAYIVKVWVDSEHLYVQLFDGEIITCTENLDRVLTQLRTPG